MKGLQFEKLSFFVVIFIATFFLIIEQNTATANEATSKKFEASEECPPDLNDEKNEFDHEASIDTAIASLIINRILKGNLEKNYRIFENACDYRIFNLKGNKESLEIVIQKNSKNDNDLKKKKVFVKSKIKYPKMTGWLIEFRTKAEIYLEQ